MVQRKADHICNAVIGAVVVVGGAVLIVATCGTAIPALAAAAPALAAAAPAMAFGATMLGTGVVVHNTMQDMQLGEARPWWEMAGQTFMGCATGAFIGYTGFAAAPLLAGSALATTGFSVLSGMLGRDVLAMADRTATPESVIKSIFDPGAIVTDAVFGNVFRWLTNWGHIW